VRVVGYRQASRSPGLAGGLASSNRDHGGAGATAAERRTTSACSRRGRSSPMRSWGRAFLAVLGVVTRSSACVCRPYCRRARLSRRRLAACCRRSSARSDDGDNAGDGANSKLDLPAVLKFGAAARPCDDPFPGRHESRRQRRRLCAGRAFRASPTSTPFRFPWPGTACQEIGTGAAAVAVLLATFPIPLSRSGSRG